MKTLDLSRLIEKLGKNKYVLLVVLLGLVLLLLPEGSDKTNVGEISDGDARPLESTGVSLEREGRKIAELLQEIKDVGSAEVLLSGEGAVVVCQGADSAAVRLIVTNAVTAYTGLGSDKIWVMKMK